MCCYSALRADPLPPALLAEIPDHPACTEALSLAQSSLPTSIFNHSLRVSLYASRHTHPATSTAPFTAPKVEPHALFVACILHDIGTADSLTGNDARRFEVTGADFAASLLKRHGVDGEVVREVWLAIAMHTSPHVAEGAGGLVRALRLAVRADFGTHAVGEAVVRETESQLPRLDVEKDLGDAVVRQAVLLPSKAPGGSWPGDLLRTHAAEPEWDGVNKAF
ncbi:Cyanamide hydratase [Cytospora mali]|uniref:Cyanamide hydratase n=1 Tax=Cytospora mali TaxID=578113 RepID=A0A194V8X4_CYTMA|nr:Cyanamide hydratase [Valsa mali var. pyri (nom. inval.)]